MITIVLAALLVILSALPSLASGHCFNDWRQAERRGNAYAFETLTFASERTRLSYPLLVGLAQQESGLGRNTGRSGAGISDAHPTRDAPLFWLLAERFGRDPRRACASRRPGYGWGGAIGVMQVIPSTFAELNGYTVTRSKTMQFSAKKRPTKRDVWIVQWFLKKRGYKHIVRDGKFGKKTKAALVQMQKKAGFSGTACQKEIGRIGGCTRAYVAVKGGLIKMSYSPKRDKVRRFFRKDRPLDPWTFEGSSLTGAYYLKKLYNRQAKYGPKRAIRFALGAYYAGPGGSWKRGQGYAESVIKRAKRVNGIVREDLKKYRDNAAKRGIRPRLTLENI